MKSLKEYGEFLSRYVDMGVVVYLQTESPPLLLSAGSEGREIPLFLLLLLSSLRGDAVCIPMQKGGGEGEKEASCPCLQRLLSISSAIGKGEEEINKTDDFGFRKEATKRGGISLLPRCK